MGTDNLFNKRRIERKNRSENIRKLKSSNWLIICEGTKTETNYFSEAIKSINKNIDNDYKLKAKIIGKGRNTLSLVNSVDSILNDIDKHRNSTIPYGKIFVVFDKDDFASDIFDKSINVCENKGYIPLWSNQAFEFWTLLHFNYIEGNISRTNYEQKINEYFKKAGLNYKYCKNDETIYSKLTKYGSLELAKKHATKIHKKFINELPSKSECCTTVYKFFEEVDNRLKEIE